MLYMAGQFLATPAWRRRSRGKVGVTPLRPAVLPSMPKAAAKVLQETPEVLKAQEKRATATAKHMQNEPVETSSPSRSGGRAGGRAPGNSTRIPEKPDVIAPMGPTHFKGTFTTKTIEFQDGVSPPRPITLSYEVGQNGSAKRLNAYKKMYKGSTFELDTPSLVVGGDDSLRKDKKIQPSTMAGYGRTNVHWPYAWADYANTVDHQLTSKTGCFTRSQIEGIFFKMFEELDASSSVYLDNFLLELELSAGGDQRIDFPLDYIECQYKYLNNNVSLPMEITLYLCQPTRNMTASHSPMYDWFNPFSTIQPAERMLNEYWYNPILTAANDVMFSASNTGNISQVTMHANRNSIVTASTEVVPEATPQGFSSRFRRNWDVKHVQKIVLQPQQELILNLKVKMSKLLDFKEFLSYDANGDKFELFKDMTIFPMLKFRGYDTTGVSKGLKRIAGSATTNRFLTTTAPRSGPCMLSTTMSSRARVNSKYSIVRGTGTELSVANILDCFQVNTRVLETYDSIERGENMPYYRVNDNLGYFSGEDTKPTVDTYYTTVLELATKSVNDQDIPNTDSLLLNSKAHYLPVINSQSDWDIIDVKTTTRNRLTSAEADIKKTSS